MLRYFYGLLLLLVAEYLSFGGHYIQAAVFAVVSIYVLGSLLKERLNL